MRVETVNIIKFLAFFVIYFIVTLALFSLGNALINNTSSAPVYLPVTAAGQNKTRLGDLVLEQIRNENNASYTRFSGLLIKKNRNISVFTDVNFDSFLENFISQYVFDWSGSMKNTGNMMYVLNDLVPELYACFRDGIDEAGMLDPCHYRLHSIFKNDKLNLAEQGRYLIYKNWLEKNYYYQSDQYYYNKFFNIAISTKGSIEVIASQNDLGSVTRLALTTVIKHIDKEMEDIKVPEEATTIFNLTGQLFNVIIFAAAYSLLQISPITSKIVDMIVSLCSGGISS